MCYMSKDSKIEKMYKTQVDEAAAKNLNKVFSNSSLEHAYFLTQKLFHSADSNIKIVTRKFNSAFYEQLMPDLLSFLEKKETNYIHIAIMERHENGILKKLIKAFPEQVILHWLDEKQSSALTNKEQHVYINFLVNDQNGFRYEYQDENMEDGIVSAFANFNDPTSANVLDNFFDTLVAA